MLDKYLKMILKAPVYDVASVTSLDYLQGLSARIGSDILLKREDTQPVFSYKIRGAYTLMASLPPEIMDKGVIAASAGNHAQGVALSAKTLNTSAIIVMPKTTPEIKVKSVSSLGGEVILHGDNYDEASKRAEEIAKEKELMIIPPYDDPYVVAGQGTVGMEILQQSKKDIDAIFVPVGGGGLIAGIAVYFKSLSPATKIIGVEPLEAPSMSIALKKGMPVTLEKVGIFADGAAVKRVGDLTFELTEKYVDEMLCVSNDEICAAIKDIYEDTRSISEPAGALALAGLKQYSVKNDLLRKNYVAICSGANINFDRLRHVAELAELGENREVLIGASIPEKPGSFRAFCEALGPRLITEFNYRAGDSDIASVFAGVQVGDYPDEKELLLKNLAERDYKPVDMSNNELAKMHVRFMVGGAGRELSNETVFRIEFPERPGALIRFLNRLGTKWNITLFHYRNHGAAYGRVLIGIQLNEAEKQKFIELIGDVKYFEETRNSAYKMFLQ